MQSTLPSPSAVESDLRSEAERRGIDAEVYTRSIMEALSEAFAKSPPEDEYSILLILSRLENELPQAWKECSDEQRLEYALVLFVFWLLLDKDRTQRVVEAVSSVVYDKRAELSGNHRYTLRELKAMPRQQREAIMRAQAAEAVPLYEADLALPSGERELTAFSALNDYAPVREPEEYLAATS